MSAGSFRRSFRTRFSPLRSVPERQHKGRRLALSKKLQRSQDSDGSPRRSGDP
jgi:hypothetical protein